MHLELRRETIPKDSNAKTMSRDGGSYEDTLETNDICALDEKDKAGEKQYFFLEPELYSCITWFRPNRIHWKNNPPLFYGSKVTIFKIIILGTWRVDKWAQSAYHLVRAELCIITRLPWGLSSVSWVEKALLCGMAGQDSWWLNQRRDFITPIAPLLCHWDLKSSQERQGLLNSNWVNSITASWGAIGFTHVHRQSAMKGPPI